MHRETRRFVRTTQVIVFIGWIAVPLIILILGATSALVGGLAFAYGLWKVALEGVKLFGDPDKWIPGHKKKREREAQISHYTYHCDRNPEGFARLCAENFEKQFKEEESSNKRLQAIGDKSPQPEP